MTTENTVPVPSPAPSPAPTSTEAPVPSTSKPWYETRIDGLTREKYEQADKISKLERDFEELKARATTSTPTAAPVVDPNKKPINLTQDEFNAAVKKQAGEEVALASFNDQCNKVFNAGKDSFEDFESSIDAFKKLGGLPIPTVEIALEMDAPEMLIYNLSKNLDRAAEIFKLSPAKQALALTKFSAEIEKQVKEDKKTSKETTTLRPVVGGTRTTSEPDPEKMSMQEFIAWREKQTA